MKEIMLTQGKVALVDDDNYEWLKQFKWSTYRKRAGLFYAKRGFRQNGKREWESMHRRIMKAKPGQQIDHINGNGIDNRKENLRICTQSVNQQNRHIPRGLSMYQGVSWSEQGKKWQAQITKDRILNHLGYFEKEEDAARAYNRKALELYDSPKLNEV